MKPVAVVDLDSPAVFAQMRGLVGDRFTAYAGELFQHGRSMWREADRAELTALERAEVFVETAQLIFEQWRNPQQPFACQEGCAYCCHLEVELLPWEADALTEWIAAQGGAALLVWWLALYVRAQRVAELNTHQYRALNLRCPFLRDDNACGVYSIRPVACVAYHAIDVRECAAGMVDPKAAISFIGEAWLAPNSLRAGALQELRASGRATEPAELHAALFASIGRRLLLAISR